MISPYSPFAPESVTSVASPSTQTVRFGPFELDLRSSELRRNGSTVRLPDQPCQILLALLESPGEVVTREELRRRLWADDTFVDFEHSLNAAVKRLRNLLDDSSDSPRYIETLPRHGYRLIVPVEKAEPAPAVPKLVVRRRIWIAVASVLLFCAVASTIWLWPWLHYSAKPIRSIAVLPLQNLSGNPDEDYFAAGMTEQLITELAQVRELRVISHQSVMQYKGKVRPLPEIARELQVDALVEGSALRQGDRVRITAQLINANPERHLWSHAYDGNFRDVLTLQSEVAQAIVREIRIKTTVEDKARLAAPRPVNPEAYEAYLKARYFWNHWGSDISKAVDYFQKAIEKDPTYAPAYAGLALCYTSQLFWSRPQETYIKARSAVSKALELDDSLAEAHAALGYTKLLYDWDWPGAEREFRRALELNPNSADTDFAYANFLTMMGRFDEAMAVARHGLSIDPLSLTMNAELAWVYTYARRYDDAIAQIKKTLELDPHYSFARWELAMAYILKRQYVDAVAEYRQVDPDGNSGYLGYLYAVMGKREEANKVLARMEENSKRYYVDPYEFATIYAGLGHKETALQWLERSYAERSAEMPNLKIDPLFDTLRSEPRFQDLMRRMNFAQ